jgi:hypothetical protein
MRGDAVQSIERRLLFRVGAQHADVDACVAQIGSDLRRGDGYEPDDPRILCRFGEKGRYLDADRFGDAVRSTRVTQMRPPLRSECALPAPYDSTRARPRP